MDNTVSIYTTPACQYCKQVKEYFAEHNVEYTEHDVSTDAEKRTEMIQKSGQMGVPVVLVGEDMMIGFNEEKLAGMLGIEA